MELNWNRALGIRAALAGAAIAAALLASSAARGDEWNKTYTVSGRAHVSLSTNDGSVRVTTADTKQIELHVYYTGYKPDHDLQIDSHQNGDSVDLTAKVRSMNWSWGISQRSLRIEVHMPREADLQVDTGDGSVEAQSVAGSLDIHTGDGHISVEGARGDIRLRTGDGGVEGRDLDGRVEATSGDGHINLNGRFDSLNIKTGDGSIEVRALPGSKLANGWNLHTGDGSVDLTLLGDLQANIDASTNDGRISLGIPVMVEGTFSRSQVHGKMNGGGQLLTIHTGDGSIRLSRS
jgi:DUF4097 and DUF4098 domain-containing protein YvlB